MGKPTSETEAEKFLLLNGSSVSSEKISDKLEAFGLMKDFYHGKKKEHVNPNVTTQSGVDLNNDKNGG